MRNALPSAPRKNEAAIVNLDSDEGLGTHWVCYKKSGNTVSYFDSFGNLRPPVELQRYFKGCSILINYHNVQAADTVICGHLCLRFLKENVQ